MYPRVTLTEDMIRAAKGLQDEISVHRTKASEIDSLTGALGEFAFAEWFTGDWRNHEVGVNQGAIDFRGIVEVKASAYPFRDTLNLLVREDYATKRHPPLYVQVIIDVPHSRASDIFPGTTAVISGFATGDAISRAPLRDFGSKYGGPGGYKCRYMEIQTLFPMSDFRKAFDISAAERGWKNTAV